jgi:CheY-like chemotaxis protein
VIRVRDKGMGIAPQELGRIFDMFVQLDSSLGRTRDGLGLGLTLVKTLVELHGGTVAARSEGPGKGSEFAVRLPLLAESSLAHPRSSMDAPSGPVARRRVLVVDDNPDAATSLAMLLEQSGHEVQVANDGLEAVEKAALFPADVILLDIGMPRMDGYEAARRIRATRKDIVLVAVTGWGQASDRQKADEAGFDHHLVKPVVLSTLERILAASG